LPAWASLDEDHEIVIFRVQEIAMESDGAEDLFGGLLQMVRGEHVGWIDEQTHGCVEVERRGVEQLRNRLLVRLRSAPIADATLARDRLGKLPWGLGCEWRGRSQLAIVDG
jgi:hypothetical protein